MIIEESLKKTSDTTPSDNTARVNASEVTDALLVYEWAMFKLQSLVGNTY
jgi:hypothetical protein